jgi:hypothetical protein
MFGHVLKSRLFQQIKASTEKSNLAGSNKSVPYSTLPDALEYAHQLKFSWIWTDEYFNPNQPSWIVLHGEERWDQNGLDTIIGLFEIPTLFSFSHYLYVYAQQGDVLCCVLDTSLDRIRTKIPGNLSNFQTSDEETFL